MRPLLTVCACLLAIGLGACGSSGTPDAPAGDAGLYAGTTLTRGGLKLPARIQGRDLALAYKGNFAGRFWPGSARKAGWPAVRRAMSGAAS